MPYLTGWYVIIPLAKLKPLKGRHLWGFHFLCVHLGSNPILERECDLEHERPHAFVLRTNIIRPVNGCLECGVHSAKTELHTAAQRKYP